MQTKPYGTTGLSEERIGRHLAHRRSEFVLSTKVGYGIPGQQDWTAGAVQAGIDAALKRLATDCIDIVHLHSCDLRTLEAGEVVEALLRARDQGKIRCYDPAGLAWDEFALRFSTWQPAVSCAIVGTSSVEHLRHNITIAEKGALPSAVVAAVRERFEALGAGWRGEV